MRQIIDNFLPKSEFDTFSQILHGEFFPWYSSTVIDPPYNLETSNLNNYQLCHAFYVSPRQHTESFELIQPFFKLLNARYLLKIKANLNPRTDSVQIHGYHTDIPYEDVTNISKTAVFYINDNDGYTIFENDKQIVSSVANRMLIFPANERHSGTSCTDRPCRLVLNFNYI